MQILITIYTLNYYFLCNWISTDPVFKSTSGMESRGYRGAQSSWTLSDHKSSSFFSSWDAGSILVLDRGEMAILKVAADYYLQRFVCSHRQCENAELHPACCWALSALAVIGERLAPLRSRPWTFDLLIHPRVEGIMWKVTHTGMYEIHKYFSMLVSKMLTALFQT